MKKLYLRWYQKEEYVNTFMELLERLPLDEQCEIAVDIIIQSFSSDSEYESAIEDIADFDPKYYKRWYDKNPNLHTAIESLRELNTEQREEILKPLITRLRDYCNKEDEDEY